MIAEHDIPVNTLKANTIQIITRTLRSLVNIDEPETSNALELNGQDDRFSEIDALEEARVTVEQIVIPKKEAVELLPRSEGCTQNATRISRALSIKIQQFR